jgi:hypothetical protein
MKGWPCAVRALTLLLVPIGLPGCGAGGSETARLRVVNARPPRASGRLVLAGAG